MRLNQSVAALTPPRNPGIRRALLLGHAIGLDERPMLIDEHVEAHRTAYILLALAALSIVMLLAVA